MFRTTSSSKKERVGTCVALVHLSRILFMLKYGKLVNAAALLNLAAPPRPLHAIIDLYFTFKFLKNILNKRKKISRTAGFVKRKSSRRRVFSHNNRVYSHDIQQQLVANY